MKVKYSPGRLGFYHLPMGCYIPGLELQEDKICPFPLHWATEAFTETAEFRSMLLTSFSTLVSRLGIQSEAVDAATERPAPCNPLSSSSLRPPPDHTC